MDMLRYFAPAPPRPDPRFLSTGPVVTASPASCTGENASDRDAIVGATKEKMHVGQMQINKWLSHTDRHALQHDPVAEEGTHSLQNRDCLFNSRGRRAFNWRGGGSIEPPAPPTPPKKGLN